MLGQPLERDVRIAKHDAPRSWKPESHSQGLFFGSKPLSIPWKVWNIRMSELLSIGWEFRSWSDGKRIPAGVIKRGWENPVAWRFWDLVRWEPSNVAACQV